jgi:hypothetical protein
VPNNDGPNAVAAADDPDAQYAELTASAPGDVEYMFAQTATGMGGSTSTAESPSMVSLQRPCGSLTDRTG